MPPRRSPTAAPPVATVVQCPRARFRSLPSGNVMSTIESADGDISAAEIPCSARSTISIVGEMERPISNDSTVKLASPTSKILRCPKMSAARPPSNRNPPNVSAYAVTTHCNISGSKWSDFPMAGSATFVMHTSSTTMNCATATRMKMSHGDLVCMCGWLRTELV